MPLLPIIGLFIVILSTAVVTITIAIAIDELIKKFKDKKIAIIGERCTGKTKLWEFLSNGTISSEYLQTQTAERVKIEKFPLKNLELKLRETQTDIPGGWDYSDSWINLAKESDYVFYLFRLPCIYNVRDCNSICPFKNMLQCKSNIDYIKKFEIIIKKIKTEEKLKQKVILVGTFSDYVEDYNQMEREGKDVNFYEKFIEKIDYKFVDMLKEFKIVFGSLKDESSAEKLAVKIFKRAMEG